VRRTVAQFAEAVDEPERAIQVEHLLTRVLDAPMTLFSWYATGMTRKIAISLPDATLGKARAAVKARAVASLSSYIGRLIEDASATETFEEMLANWVQESGATSAEIRAAQKESLEAFERAGLIQTRNRREKAGRKAG